MSDASPRPWRLTGQTIRDAEGVVVMSAINPADMETRRLIVDAVNARGAPARNCDRYANAAQALGAYPDGPQIGDEWDDADWMMLLDWLFALAEGGQECES